MEALRQDLRHAIRSLLRHKTVALTAVLTLALALGIGTALFSVVDGVLLRPLPYPDSGQLVRVSEQHPGGTGALASPMLSDLTLDAWKDMRTLEGVAPYSSRTFTWTAGDAASRMAGAAVSPALFPLLRVAPHRGRFFTEDEAQQGADTVAVLSHGLWMEQFGGRDAAVGEYLRLDGRDYLVVGIAPPGFAFPTAAARLWTPFTRPVMRGGEGQSVYIFQAIGRLRPRVTDAQAEAEGTAAARGVARPPVADMLFGQGGPVEVRVVRVLHEVTAHVRPALMAMSAGVTLVLLIACANVANLLLTYGLARRREMAVRAALGATGARLVRLFLVETLLLAAAGVVLGLGLAWFIIDAVPAIAPATFPRLENVGMNARVVAAGGVAALVAALLSGILPAWRSSRADLALAQKDDDGRSAGMATTKLRFALLVAEAALALVLIVGAGLLVRSVGRLVDVDSGYDPSNVLTARIVVAGASPATGRSAALADDLVRRVRALPGVVSAGAGNMAPFGGSTFVSRYELSAAGRDGEPLEVQAASNVVTPGFVDALRLRVLEGRSFTDADAGAGVRVLVSESFARRYLDDGRPVAGRQLALKRGAGGDTSWTIVGVVGDVRPDGPRTEPRAELYFLQGSDYQVEGSVHLVVRTAGDPSALVPALRQVVRDTDPSAAVDAIGPLSHSVSGSIAESRFFAVVLTVFAGLALLLAAIGLYGVLSYVVTLRRRELGVRAALGARRTDLLRLVVTQGLGATVAGLAAGLVLAVWAARLMRTLLFGIEPLDLPTFAGAAGVLLLVALAASLVPARRAASSDPLEVLRHQ